MVEALEQPTRVCMDGMVHATHARQALPVRRAQLPEPRALAVDLVRHGIAREGGSAVILPVEVVLVQHHAAEGIHERLGVLVLGRVLQHLGPARPRSDVLA